MSDKIPCTKEGLVKYIQAYAAASKTGNAVLEGLACYPRRSLQVHMVHGNEILVQHFSEFELTVTVTVRLSWM